MLLCMIAVSGCMRHSGNMRLANNNKHVTQSPPEQELPQLEISPVSQETLQRLNNRKARQRLVKAAAKAVGKKRLRVSKQRYRADCSGTVRAIYAKAGFPLGGTSSAHGENDVRILYRYVQQNGALHRATPLPGDLVFFHATYDRSGNGHFDDPLTHVGIVEKVLKDQTIIFVHRMRKSIVRSRMNLQHPRARRDPTTQRPINHVLRRDSPEGESATAGQLFACFGRVKMK